MGDETNVVDTPRVSVAIIGINHAKIADDSAIGHFRNTGVVKGDRGCDFVHVVDGDRKQFVVRKSGTGLIGRRDGDVDGFLGLVIERLAALEAPYILTSGTVAPDDPEDGDIIPDMTLWGYRLLASRAYERRVHTGWYIWHRQCDDASSTENKEGFA